MRTLNWMAIRSTLGAAILTAGALALACGSGETQPNAAAQKPNPDTFLDDAAREPGATRTASGLVFRSLTEGQGESPAATDTVRVHYAGTLVDGKEFDSSIKRGQPAEFPLNGVIPCWTEGLQLMKVGGKARLVCPASIAYGARGRPPVIPGGATLVFEVELLGVKH
jgi:FKBP-type peptidyl-prolyl cis-trans isomerase FkpA